MSRFDGQNQAHILDGWWRRAKRLVEACRRAITTLPAWPLMGGVALGFGLCCFAGRLASERPMFKHFVHFYAPITPATFFYPTASELVSYVRCTVPRDKCLVVVGGASYFRGAGQNPNELWTLELQRLLGDKYAVVNFAMDRAGITSFAAVAFQVLSREYPKIIYVCNASSVVANSIDGGDVYQYVFWDAYYKGMLSTSDPWLGRVRELAKTERKDPTGLELHLGKWTDQFSYACDLWTYIGYKHFFTVWSDGMPTTFTSARHEYVDGFNPNLAQEQQAFRNSHDYAQHYEEENKGYVAKGFILDKSGRGEIDQPAWDLISQLSQVMLPDNLRPKCYLVLVRGNRYFMRSFTADDWRRYELMYSLGQQAHERAGYKVIQLPDADFTPDDFWDAGHFMASGGRKVAAAVAARIKEGN